MAIPSYPTIAAIGENLDRINALYSPFRARNLNPEHYEEKLRFWLKSVDDYHQVENKTVFSVKELEIAFRSNGRVSACMADVIEYMMKQKTVLPMEDYLNSLRTAEGWISWSMKPVKFIASSLWNVTPLKSLTDKKITKETKLVYLPAIDTTMSKLLSCTDIQNKILLREEWIDQISKIVHAEEAELYTAYLTSKGQLVLDRLGEDTEIVKFIVPSPARQDLQITAAEKGQFDLKRTKTKLEDDLEHVLAQQNKCLDAARDALQQKQRTKAKYHLRCKNVLEKRADKLHNLISNLTDLSYQIEDAKSDALIISAYETGKTALKKVLEDNNITVDRANDAMMDLEDALEDQAEISSALGRSVTVEDETLLEQELAELLELDELEKLEVDKTAIPEEPDVAEQLRRLEKLNLSGVDIPSVETTTPNKSLSQV